MKSIVGFLTAMEAFLSIAAGFSGKSVTIVNSRDLTADMLYNRHDTVIIELVFGCVDNEFGDGFALNAADPEYNYISYAGVSCNPGDFIATLFVYDPDGNDVDDIKARFDVNLGDLGGLFGVQKIHGLY